MAEKRKRNALHSGIGDHQDLLVKQPVTEDIEEKFQYAARLRGKKRHETRIYPEIPFRYGISYKGKTLETYNEKPYEFNINAHPEKVIEYCIKQVKELPVKRMWEAKACFEAEVWRMNMKYALHWEGLKEIQVRNKVDYAVNWRAVVTSRDIKDARSFFTSQNGHFIGYGDETTWKQHKSGYIYDYSNVSRFSGIIAKDYYGIENYEAEFDFKTVLATNDQHVGGNDDDIVGIIFKAKDKKNFYMMLWERDERVFGSWRAPDDLDGFNMLTSGASAWEKRVRDQGCASSSSWSSSQRNNYINNRGWRLKHRRVYKVTNGVMKRVDTTPNSGKLGYDSSVKDLGNGAGWKLNTMHGLKINSVGKRVDIYCRTGSGGWQKIFSMETDWAKGSFGTVNVSQAVQFHRIQISEKNLIEGRIPETGWHSMQQAEKNLGTGYNYCIKDAEKKAKKLKESIPTIDTRTIDFIQIQGRLKDSSKGSITSSVSPNENIIVKAWTHTEYNPIKGRVKNKGWYEYDGIGDYVVAENARQFIKKYDANAASDKVEIKKIYGEVYKDPKYPVPTGTVIVESLNGKIIARSNNPKDSGKIYKECFIKCKIVEITPDHRSYETGLVVFEDIANEFREEEKKFFNRIDYINKKRSYELLKPVWKDPPLPPIKDISEGGGCVIYEEDPEVPEEIIECLNEFDFNGRRLIMWSCEFPIDEEIKCFEDRVVAYKGWTIFDPLKSFTPNKWTYYNLMPIEGSINPEYDAIRWTTQESLEGALVGSKIQIKTTEWYRAIFPADIENNGIVTTDANVVAQLPPAPEHFWHPNHLNSADVKWRMPDSYDVVHYLLDAWNNHPDVVMYFESHPEKTTDNVSKKPEDLAVEGFLGMPVLVTTNDHDRIVIMCKEDPRQIPWTSGKYIGHGKVNGKRPFFADGAGKADMVNVSTRTVYFPENLIMETLEGPFIDIYDEENPNHPRVQYRIHSNDELVDFYSNFMDSYVWFTDWYSKWVKFDEEHIATLLDVKQIPALLDLDPTDPNVSDDYDPSNTIVEKVEVVSNNPFVKLWTEQESSNKKGLFGTYYRHYLGSNQFEHEFKVEGDYQEWIQTYEIKSYMKKIEIPFKHTNVQVINVTIGGEKVPQSNSNGWYIQNNIFHLANSAIRPGELKVVYSIGDIENSFVVGDQIGEHVEVFVNGEIIPPSEYSITEGRITINKNQLSLNDWVHVQSYTLYKQFDPTQKYYMGDKEYTQLDFQEDVPSNSTNPNYQDPYYEGVFSFDWGHNRPIGME